MGIDSDLDRNFPSDRKYARLEGTGAATRPKAQRPARNPLCQADSARSFAQHSSKLSLRDRYMVDHSGCVRKMPHIRSRE
jgi:hypothetical protein